MDDNSEPPEDGPGRPNKERSESRISLVERAAGKLIDKPGSAGAADGAFPQPETEAVLPLNAPLPEYLDPASKAGAPHAEDNGNSRQVAANASLLVKDPAPVPRSEGRRKTRTVKLDLASLASLNIITPSMKRSRTVEEFRLIKRMVLSRQWDEGDLPGNTILVTSALPTEGKTTTAINLAMSIAAEEDLRVLLVDADFIKPDALRRLGVNATKGLIDVIQDPRMDISDVILRTDIEKLSLIPSGQLRDRCTELLASARMDHLIAELANRYEDRILIFDSPPLLATTEAVTLASHMGQIVFVVQAERTKRETVNSALELLDSRQHLGIVLNKTTHKFGNVNFGAYYGEYYYGDKDSNRS